VEDLVGSLWQRVCVHTFVVVDEDVSFEEVVLVVLQPLGVNLGGKSPANEDLVIAAEPVGMQKKLLPPEPSGVSRHRSRGR
jgi:hypothetical protein